MCSGMARVLKGSHSFTCTPTRSSAIRMSHTCLCLPSYSWYSFTDPGGWKAELLHWDVATLLSRVSPFSTSYLLLSVCLFACLSVCFCFNGHFPGGARLTGELRMMEVVVTSGAVRRAKLQSKCHHQRANTQYFTGRMPFLSPNQQCLCE